MKASEAMVVLLLLLVAVACCCRELFDIWHSYFGSILVGCRLVLTRCSWYSSQNSGTHCLGTQFQRQYQDLGASTKIFRASTRDF